MQEAGQSCLITQVGTACHNEMKTLEMCVSRGWEVWGWGEGYPDSLCGCFSYSNLLPVILISSAVYLSTPWHLVK